MCTHNSPHEVRVYPCAGGAAVQTRLPTCHTFAGAGEAFRCDAQTESIAKGNAVGTKATCPGGSLGLIWVRLKCKSGVTCQLHGHRARTPPVIPGSHFFFVFRISKVEAACFSC